jgi:hypothetical protein
VPDDGSIVEICIALRERARKYLTLHATASILSLWIASPSPFLTPDGAYLVKLPAIVRRYGKEAAWVAGGCLVGYLLASTSGGRWVSTGNGRTVLNTRTGEIRDSFTGEAILNNTTSQLEVEERDRLRRAAAKGEASLANSLAQFQERRRSLELPPLEISNEDRALWLLDAPASSKLGATRHDRFGIVEAPNGDPDGSVRAKAKAEAEGVANRNALRARLRACDDAALAQELAKLKDSGDVRAIKIVEAFTASRAHNSQKEKIFKELQDFADKNADVRDASTYTNAAWQSVTQPLRISDELTSKEANRLLDVLGQITGYIKYRTNEDFRRAIQLVREYQTLVETGSADWWQLYDEGAAINPADAKPMQGTMTAEEFEDYRRDQDIAGEESTEDE